MPQRNKIMPRKSLKTTQKKHFSCHATCFLNGSVDKIRKFIYWCIVIPHKAAKNFIPQFLIHSVLRYDTKKFVAFFIIFFVLTLSAVSIKVGIGRANEKLIMAYGFTVPLV